MAAGTLLAELMANEKNPKALVANLAPGCIYRQTQDSESRIGPRGQAQVRTRACREVTDCKDPAYNVPKNCDQWSDWTDA
jgi:hypothetical protein